jgi:hypothetical protein
MPGEAQAMSPGITTGSATAAGAATSDTASSRQARVSPRRTTL